MCPAHLIAPTEGTRSGAIKECRHVLLFRTGAAGTQAAQHRRPESQAACCQPTQTGQASAPHLILLSTAVSSIPNASTSCSAHSRQGAHSSSTDGTDQSPAQPSCTHLGHKEPVPLIHRHLCDSPVRPSGLSAHCSQHSSRKGGNWLGCCCGERGRENVGRINLLQTFTCDGKHGCICMGRCGLFQASRLQTPCDSCASIRDAQHHQHQQHYHAATNTSNLTACTVALTTHSG